MARDTERTYAVPNRHLTYKHWSLALAVILAKDKDAYAKALAEFENPEFQAQMDKDAARLRGGKGHDQ